MIALLHMFCPRVVLILRRPTPRHARLRQSDDAPLPGLSVNKQCGPKFQIKGVRYLMSRYIGYIDISSIRYNGHISRGYRGQKADAASQTDEPYSYSLSYPLQPLILDVCQIMGLRLRLWDSDKQTRTQVKLHGRKALLVAGGGGGACEQRSECLGDQQRPHGVHLVAVQEVLGIDLGKGGLREEPLGGV